MYTYKRDYITKRVKRVIMNSYDPEDSAVYFDTVDEARKDYLQMSKTHFCKWQIYR